MKTYTSNDIVYSKVYHKNIRVRFVIIREKEIQIEQQSKPELSK